MRNLLLGFILLVGIVGCNNDEVIFKQVDTIPDALWSYGDVYDYTFEITDTNEIYLLLLYLEFSTEYNWENLYTQIGTTYPNDSTRTDVLSFELASNTGAWYGDCNTRRCELNIPLQENVKFQMPGRYRLSFEQYMREEVVEGIEGIGLKVVVPRP